MKNGTQKKIIMGQTAAVVGFAGFAVLVFMLRHEIRHVLGVPPGVVLMIVSAGVAAGTAMIFMRYLGGQNNGHRNSFATEITENTERTHAFGGRISGENPISAPSAPSTVTTATDADAVFSATSLRLRREIAALSRRGNLNLTIGVITTGFALGLLAYMIFDESTSPDSFAAALSHYVPRVTTVTFIEVFSFFFLKLYRTSLQENKFYQNELTCLASLQIALETSRDCPDPDVLRTVLAEISRHNPNNCQLALSGVERLSAVSPVPEDATLASLGEVLTKTAVFASSGIKAK